MEESDEIRDGDRNASSASASEPSTTPTPATDDESLVLLAGAAAGGCALDLAIWLAPTLVLGGLGIVLFSSGSETTESAFGASETAVSSSGWFGLGLIALAAATFFGRGTLRSIAAAFSRDAPIGASLFLASNVTSMFLSLAAIAAAGLCFAVAAGVIDGG